MQSPTKTNILRNQFRQEDYKGDRGALAPWSRNSVTVACRLSIIDTRRRVFSNLIRGVRMANDRNRLKVCPNRTPLLATVGPNVVHVIGRRNRRRFVCLSNNVLRIRPNGIAILTSATVHNRSLSRTQTVRTGHGTRRRVDDSRNSMSCTRTSTRLTGTVTRLHIVRLAGGTVWRQLRGRGDRSKGELTFFCT